MSALELAGLLPHLGDLTPGAAERWITASLAQATALHEHDGWLYPTDPQRQVASERLHEAWRSWADDAEALLHRAEAVRAAGHPVARLDDLRDEVGRARAMLQLTPSMIAQRREQVRRGEAYPVEEVRRELRAGHRR
jgi:hypothetical protein